MSQWSSASFCYSLNKHGVEGYQQDTSCSDFCLLSKKYGIVWTSIDSLIVPMVCHLGVVLFEQVVNHFLFQWSAVKYGFV